MKDQKNQSQTQLLGLLTEIVKQNNQVMQQNSQVMQQNSQLISLVQVQTAQNNELLLMLEEQEEVNEHRYMDE